MSFKCLNTIINPYLFEDVTELDEYSLILMDYSIEPLILLPGFKIIDSGLLCWRAHVYKINPDDMDLNDWYSIQPHRCFIQPISLEYANFLCSLSLNEIRFNVMHKKVDKHVEWKKLANNIYSRRIAKSNIDLVFIKEHVRSSHKGICDNRTMKNIKCTVPNKPRYRKKTVSYTFIGYYVDEKLFFHIPETKFVKYNTYIIERSTIYIHEKHTLDLIMDIFIRTKAREYGIAYRGFFMTYAYMGTPILIERDETSQFC